MRFTFDRLAGVNLESAPNIQLKTNAKPVFIEDKSSPAASLSAASDTLIPDAVVRLFVVDSALDDRVVVCSAVVVVAVDVMPLVVFAVVDAGAADDAVDSTDVDAVVSLVEFNVVDACAVVVVLVTAVVVKVVVAAVDAVVASVDEPFVDVAWAVVVVIGVVVSSQGAPAPVKTQPPVPSPMSSNPHSQSEALLVS